jgi:hypothetical protein
MEITQILSYSFEIDTNYYPEQTNRKEKDTKYA